METFAIIRDFEIFVGTRNEVWKIFVMKNDNITHSFFIVFTIILVVSAV